MKVLITGAQGFIGRNLVADLRSTTHYDILELTRHTDEKTKIDYLTSAHIIIHLIGVHRPKRDSEFFEGNVGILESYLDIIKLNPNHPTIILASSIQATRDNSYGESKKESEKLLKMFSEQYGNPILIYRLPNIFGKWSKPNYNSVVATFCYNIARNKPIMIENPDTELQLNYIDDVITEIKCAIEGRPTLDDNGYPIVPNVYHIQLQSLARILTSFKQMRINKSVPDLSRPLIKALYSTYLSFLAEDDFNYTLDMHRDERGSFTEMIKTTDRGQISVNVSKPGIVKGNHWHHTKNEKFLVVAGTGVIRFRLPYDTKVIEYFVSADNLEVIDIPVGYTHHIENLGQSDMVTIMWANEIFDAKHPDTYYLEV